MAEGEPLDNPNFHREKECGRCHKETRVINVGSFGSDPYIENLLCVTCLHYLADQLTPSAP